MFMHSNRIAPYANKFNNGYFRLVLCGIIVKNYQFKPVGQIHVFVRPPWLELSGSSLAQAWLDQLDDKNAAFASECCCSVQPIICSSIHLSF